jgi:hypothetical protein
MAVEATAEHAARAPRNRVTWRRGPATEDAVATERRVRRRAAVTATLARAALAEAGAATALPRSTPGRLNQRYTANVHPGARLSAASPPQFALRAANDAA